MWKKIFKNEKSDMPENGKSFMDQVDLEMVPRHVAIIMDGNGRWANKQGLIRTAGHTAGVKTLKEIVRAADALHLEALTVYAFSTENWKRPASEVEFLMNLFSEYLNKEIQEMHEMNVRLDFIGKVWELSKGLQKQVADSRELTKNNTGVKFTVAVNYGGQDELVRAMQRIAADAAAGRIKADAITPAMVEDNLDTRGLPPVDLVIRTSGDQRLSNFLLWQSAYAELWFTDVNWPDFNREEFAKAIIAYGKRDRRFGGLSKK